MLKKKNMNILARIVGSLSITGLMACTSLQRHPSSGYQNLNVYGETSYAALKKEALSEQVQYAASELGLNGKNLSEYELQLLQDRASLSSIENQITSSREKELYYRYRPYLRSDREKIKFLQQPGYDGKAEWLVSQGIDERIGQILPEEKELIEDSDIGKGMSREAVRSSWGEPDSVDISGSNLSGNERWTYLHTVTTPEGFLIEKRIVLFQAGRVAGWETQQAH